MRHLLIIVLLSIGQLLCGQNISRDVLSCSGGAEKLDNKIISYTIGEVITGDVNHFLGIATQGFEQPDKLDVTAIKVHPSLTVDCSIFPNPCVDEIHIQWNALKSGKMKVYITDGQGRVLKQSSLQNTYSGTVLMDISHFPPGILSVILMDDRNLLLSTPVKVIKLKTP